jgi:quercetin dioxygenase-like cupin family protein
VQALERFLGLAGAAVAAQAAGAAAAAARRTAALLAAEPEPGAGPAPARQPACAHLPAALRAAPPALGAAFQALEPQLAWRASDRPGLGIAYAGAPVLGPGGLQQRGGLVAGISLLAPGVTYPDHDHPPEEIYLALSGGEWWNAETPWHAPGAGGIVHNPPGILHAMRGTGVPLLALWFLLPATP